MKTSKDQAPDSDRRTEWLTVRLTKNEHQKIARRQQKTLNRSLSDYARTVLLGEAIRQVVVDPSRGKTIEELVENRRQLMIISNNFNQVVKRIHKLSDIPNKDFWLKTCTELQKDLLSKIDCIQQVIDKIYAKW
ncbi:plasmid mobilization protein [Niabella sp. CJ426]|uniref:plasmid mobilization protein n=1 Tax=Niabella sp. CJ426 TaxID=3393740 RepID=UPI003D092C5D